MSNRLGDEFMTFQSSKRAAAILILCGALVGCGFQPLLRQGADGGAPENLASIRVNPVEGRSGQILRNHLIDDLNRGLVGAQLLYTLDILLQEPRQEIAIRRDETASRVAYTANANFILRDQSGKHLFGGSASSSSTYEATTSEFASIAGQRSARDRSMQEISTDIRQQLAAYFLRTRRVGAPSAQ